MTVLVSGRNLRQRQKHLGPDRPNRSADAHEGTPDRVDVKPPSCFPYLPLLRARFRAFVRDGGDACAWKLAHKESIPARGRAQRPYPSSIAASCRDDALVRGGGAPCAWKLAHKDNIAESRAQRI